MAQVAAIPLMIGSVASAATITPLMAIGAAGSIGAAAMSGVASARAARDQNRAIGRSMESQGEAARIETEQLQASFNLERAKNANEAAQIEGRIRVLAGERGVGTAGTMAALLRQSDYDEAINASIMERNYLNQAARINSGLEANVNALAARAPNAIMEGLSSAASTGLAAMQFTQGVKGLKPEWFETGSVAQTPPTLRIPTEQTEQTEQIAPNTWI